MYRLLVVLAALAAPALALGQASPPPASRQAAPAAAPKAVLAEIDASWKERDQPGVLDAMGAKLGDALKQYPDDYEVLWRISRHDFWIADDPNLDKKEKSRIGKIAWDYGDKATVANPARVEGWNYAAAGMGNYALGIGIFAALRQGIEGKFKDRLSRAQSIDAKFEHGAIYTAWGRFWYELPWPKYSANRSNDALNEALRLNPDNVRAHVYLSDLHAKEGRPAEARAQLERAIAKPPGRYDAPEERRWQAVARARLGAKQ